MGNLFNWATQRTAASFPDLGSTNSVEWCANRYESTDALVVGDSSFGGLAYVDSFWRDGRDVSIAFRFLVQFPVLSKAAGRVEV